MSAQIMKKTGLAILVTHIIKESGGCFVATCPEFMVTTQGKTIEDANNNLKEAVILYVETLEQLGIRDSVYKKRNIKILKQKDKIKSKTIDLDLSKNSGPFITTQFIPLAC